MERGENQAAGFSGGQSDFNSFHIARLAYEYNVGILSESGSDGGAEDTRIRADFSLINDTEFIFMDILYDSQRL